MTSDNPHILYHLAIADKDLARVKDIVENLDVDVNTIHPNLTNYTPLYHAASARAYDIVDYLLEKNATYDPNFTFEMILGGNFPNEGDREKSQKAFIKLHQKHGFPLNGRDGFGSSLLHVLASNQDDETLAYVMTHINDLDCRNNKGETILHTACRFKSAKAIKIIMQKAPHLVNLTDNNNQTPLHIAVENEISLEDMITENSNPNLKDKNGHTPFHIACHYFPMGKRQLLEGGNCDLNLPTSDGMRPLHLLHQGGYYYAIKPLLALGADPTLTDNMNNNFLSYMLANYPVDPAFHNDVFEIYQTLTDKCDPYQRNTNGKDSFHLAQKHPDPKVAPLIENMRIEKKMRDFQSQNKDITQKNRKIAVKRRKPKPSFK